MSNKPQTWVRKLPLASQWALTSAAVCLLERVDFHGHGHWLGLGPPESAATMLRPNADGSLLLFEDEELGLHISEGSHNTREGNALLFGTWDHPPFVFNADGTISPKAKTSLVLGFAPCPFQHPDGAHDVDGGVVQRVGHRRTDIGLGRQVEHDVGALHEAPHLRQIRDVSHDYPRLCSP